MEKVIRKISFEEAEKKDVEYWAGKSPQERLAALTRLRVAYHGGLHLEKIIQRVHHDR